MSPEMKNRINELQRFQAIISKKLLNKFGINNNHNETIDEWGWFIDPEINYFKTQIVTQFSIPTTIQEEIPKIGYTECKRYTECIHNINNIHNQIIQVNVSESNYINIVGLATLFSLFYIFIVL